MYFKKEDIQNVKKHIIKRADEIQVIIGAEDEARFNQTIATIVRKKQYSEGEDIAPEHTTLIKKNINTAILNLSNYLIKNADTLKNKMDLSNPVDYLTTAVDGLYITAMEQLGCPNMPIILFDVEVKRTLEEAAIEIHQSFVDYNISKKDTFNKQRGKDTIEVSKEFGLLADGINEEKKAESVGKMIAEYQAFKEHHNNHNAFWRFFHRTENTDGNALIEKMGKSIQEQLPNEMKDINLDEVVPNLVSYNIANALIREEVEAVGPRRLDNQTSAQLYGCVPLSDGITKQDFIDEYSKKMSMSKDTNFIRDIMGVDNVKTEQVPKEKVFTNPNLVKD